MCAAGTIVLLIGLVASREEFAEARGADKIVALANVCYGMPLAVFGALHFFAPQSVLALVPKYMPGRLFWVYLVGSALVAASLSIAARVAVRWSGLLVGIMMFLFVAMIHVARGVLVDPHNRILWTIVFRESSFGGAGWVLAGNAMDGRRGQSKGTLIRVGRTVVALAAIFFGIQHFFHPLGLPGVPLKREMPAWVPARVVIDGVTGAALVIAGGCMLLNRKARMAATALGAWILLTILLIYGPVLIGALSSTATAAQVEGINYFADTLLFAGAVLAVASASPRSDNRRVS
ncbi:MAG TPA: hypothetical protein VFS34_16080 [Thermoanaerobaculia bacterium]|nr:hypothetical protein [Thermoanaerobaculia bacterium]